MYIITVKKQILQLPEVNDFTKFHFRSNTSFVDIPSLLAAVGCWATRRMEELAVEVCGKNGAYYKVIFLI